MRNFMALTEALDYIEDSIGEPIGSEDIAASCHVSRSSLEKLFRFALGCSVKEYVTKRRITRAAADIKAGLGVTEAAMKYGYNSPEVFSRAFRQVWNVNPSRFSAKWSFTGIFPRRDPDISKGDERKMTIKMDISDAYEIIDKRRGTLVLCFDVAGLAEFNKKSSRAGDLALLEAAARMDRAAGDDMLLLRVGADEFALLTGLRDVDEALALARRVLAENGKEVDLGEEKKPLSLYAALCAVPERGASSDALLSELQSTMDVSKLSGGLDVAVGASAKAQAAVQAEQRYGGEAREKYGDDSVDASMAAASGMSEEQWRASEALRVEMSGLLAEAISADDPACEAAQRACDLHRRWLCLFWKPGMYSKSAHLGLASMYVADQRFREYYDRIAPGAADFLQRALEIYCA